MQPTSPRTPVAGPPFIRQLARLTGTHPAPPRLSPPERLGEWLDWTRAVAVSQALDGPPAAPAAGDTGDDSARACADARASLATAIAREPADDGTGFSPFQRHCLSVQRAIQTHSGRLRGQLRERLAARSPAHARLAEVDAALEAALSPREHSLLAALPALLERRFEQLRETAPDTWQDSFRRDMRDALLAELDLRFKPVDALLAALDSR